MSKDSTGVAYMRDQHEARARSGERSAEAAGTMLTCPHCRERQPATRFGSTTWDGREHDLCRECREERHRCRTCGTIQPQTAFRYPRSSNGTRYRYPDCTDCYLAMRSEIGRTRRGEGREATPITAARDRQRRQYTAKEWRAVCAAADAFGQSDQQDENKNWITRCPNTVVVHMLGDPDEYLTDEHGEIVRYRNEPIAIGSDQEMVARQSQILSTALLLHREQQREQAA